MTTRIKSSGAAKLLLLLAATAALGCLLAGATARTALADAMPMPMMGAVGDSGLQCQEATAGANGPEFELWATEGRIDMPDGNSLYMWGFAPDATSEAPAPGPNLCVTEGERVTVTLHNKLAEATSIVFPGQEGVQADTGTGPGPAQPQFDGANLTSMTQTAAANTGTATYTFTATKPGTYLYESGTSPEKQVQMGLYGALIVRPQMGANFAYNDPSTQFNPDREYLMLLQEVDPALHEAVEANKPYSFNRFKPRYWTLNGRSFPDTLAPNNASYLPNQPYGSMLTTQPYDPDPASPNNKPALVRYLNAGVNPHPMHPHGNHIGLFAHDGQMLANASSRFTQNIGPGQTWDGFFEWKDVEHWSPTNPVPVTLPGVKNLIFGDHVLYGGSPYLGKKGPLPVGTASHNQCGEFYFISHSHAAYEMNTWDAGMGGAVTFFRVDPANGCP
jgi:FtsP/CotA-like multicopper oxidase with cupredoxin domain